MALTHGTLPTITDGLVISLDAGNVKSIGNYSASSSSTITYVGGTSQDDSSSDLTLTGLQSGDLVLFYSASDSVNRNTPSSGWTAIPGLGTQPDNDNNPDSAAFYKFSTGTSVTAGNLDDDGVHVMIAFRGVDSSNPFNVNSVETFGFFGMPNPTTITTTDGCMIVAVGLLDDDDVASSVTAPSGYTLAVVDDTSSSDCTVMTAYKTQTSAGSENPGAFGGSGSDTYKAQTNALQKITISGTETWTNLVGSINGTITNSSEVVFNSDGWFDWTDGPGSDTTGGYVSLPNTAVTLGSTYTIEVWNYYDASSPPQAPWTGGNLWTNSAEDDWSTGAGNNNGLLFGYNSVVYRNTSGTEIEVDYSSNPTTQVWHQHVLVVDSGSGTVYVDKTSVASLSNMRTLGQSNGTLGIGIADKIGGSDYRGEYLGFISVVKVYVGKALTLSEITQNYNALKDRYGI